jgi:hypothetical protein
MGGREEQKEEREVLDSIFPDEITGMPRRMSMEIVANTQKMSLKQNIASL